MRYLRTLTTICGAAAFLGACSADTAEETAPKTGTSQARLYATYRGTVTFEAGEPVISLEPIRVVSAMAQSKLDPGKATLAEQSVLNDVSLSGPGTWDAATETLSASVRITATGGSDLDEPKMQITRICEGQPSIKCTSCTAQEITDGTCSVDANAAPGVTFEGVHGGGNRVGSYYAYADIEIGGGAVASSARQNFAAKSVGAATFSFEVDVLADPVGVPIDPDDDDDTYNGETGEDAGGDCNDNDADIHPGATEICDGKDNDCVNGVDDGTDRAGCTNYYRDNDGDNYGDPGDSTCTCSSQGVPPGYDADSLDCCDTDGAVNPAGTFSTIGSSCGGYDMNCDTVEEPQLTGAGSVSCDFVSCSATRGWEDGTAPACGVSESYVTGCTQIFFFVCLKNTDTRTQPCR